MAAETGWEMYKPVSALPLTNAARQFQLSAYGHITVVTRLHFSGWRSTMITSLPLTRTETLAPAASAKFMNGLTGTASQSASSFANSFAGMLAQILESSSNGSQFEIGISTTQNPNSPAGQFTITVKNVTPTAGATSLSNTTVGNPASSSAAAASAAGSTAGASSGIASATSPASGTAAANNCETPPTRSGYPPGSEAFIKEFGSGPTSEPEPPVKPIPTPAFYQPPPTKSVSGVKTMESVMQDELVMTQYGTSQMIQGTWNLKYLTDSFRDQAQRVISAANRNTDPSIAPANWRDIADQYSSMYLQWLSKTDASYWDPKLSGPVYDPATGIVQTASGPVDSNGTPMSTMPPPPAATS